MLVCVDKYLHTISVYVNSHITLSTFPSIGGISGGRSPNLHQQNLEIVHVSLDGDVREDLLDPLWLRSQITGSS